MSGLWNVDSFISSYWGMYAVQTVLHSIVASALIDCAFIAWDIRGPRLTQRFRFLVIFLPAASFPIYQLITPGRGGVYFRLGSLLDSNKWLFFEFGGVPIFKILIVLSAAVTALIFVFQEFLPMAVHMLEQFRGDSGADGPQPVENPLEGRLAEALEGLPIGRERVSVLDDEDLVIFSDTWRNPQIYISTGLIRAFDAPQLRAALAHEVGHIQRSKKPVLIVAYVLRLAMFYNPVAMIEFRKLAQEEEKICDDFAIGMTGRPSALRQAIEMLREPVENPFSPEREGKGKGAVRGFDAVASAFEQYGLDSLLRSRIRRIGHPLRDEAPWRVPFLITFALIAGINYFVV